MALGKGSAQYVQTATPGLGGCKYSPYGTLPTSFNIHMVLACNSYHCLSLPRKRGLWNQEELPPKLNEEADPRDKGWTVLDTGVCC